MSSRPPRELTRDQRAAIRKQVTKRCANYDNQDQLCLPLDCPCYMLQKWWSRFLLPVFPGGGAAG